MIRKMYLMAAVILLVPSGVMAQTLSSDQLEVWELIEESWAANASDERGLAWLEEHLHPDFEGVGSLYPMPIGKAKLLEGMKYDRAVTKSDFYLLEPQRVILHGSTAVVHYLYYWVYNTRATKDSDPKSGQKKRSETSVFVKDNGKWMLIASHGSDID